MLTSQTVGTETINWSVMLPLAETVDVDDAIVIDLVGSDVVFDTRRRVATHVHRYTTSGTPVAGWGAGGVATLAAGFGDVGGFSGAGRRPRRRRQRQLVRFTRRRRLHVDRLLSNGAVDSTFPRVSTPMGGDLTASDIAGAPDGGVLVTTQTATPARCAATRVVRHRRWRR